MPPAPPFGRRLLLALAGASGLRTLLGGRGPAFVPIDELVTDPARYHGQPVRTRGVVMHSNEGRISVARANEVAGGPGPRDPRRGVLLQVPWLRRRYRSGYEKIGAPVKPVYADVTGRADAERPAGPDATPAPEYVAGLAEPSAVWFWEVEQTEPPPEWFASGRPAGPPPGPRCTREEFAASFTDTEGGVRDRWWELDLPDVFADFERSQARHLHMSLIPGETWEMRRAEVERFRLGRW